MFAMLPLVVIAGLFGLALSSPLLMFQPPQIIGSSPESVSLITGDTMLLSCIVEAHSPPTAKIIKLNEDTDNSIDDIYDIMDFDISSNSVEDNLIEVTLTQEVSALDSGWYRCKATNKYGEAHVDFFVEVFDDKFPFVLESEDLLEKELGGGLSSSSPVSESGALKTPPVSESGALKTAPVSETGAMKTPSVTEGTLRSNAMTTEGGDTTRTESQTTPEPLSTEPPSPETTPYYFKFI